MMVDLLKSIVGFLGLPRNKVLLNLHVYECLSALFFFFLNGLLLVLERISNFIFTFAFDFLNDWQLIW